MRRCVLHLNFEWAYKTPVRVSVFAKYFLSSIALGNDWLQLAAYFCFLWKVTVPLLRHRLGLDPTSSQAPHCRHPSSSSRRLDKVLHSHQGRPGWRGTDKLPPTPDIFKTENVFVQIKKCICLNKKVFVAIVKLFVQIAKCICPGGAARSSHARYSATAKASPLALY